MGKFTLIKKRTIIIFFLSNKHIIWIVRLICHQFYSTPLHCILVYLPKFTRLISFVLCVDDRICNFVVQFLTPCRSPFKDEDGNLKDSTNAYLFHRKIPFQISFSFHFYLVVDNLLNNTSFKSTSSF